MNKLNKDKLWLLGMNLIDLNEEGYLLNGWYSNVEDVKCKFNKDGYYRFNSDSDCNILIDSIEYIGIDCYVDDKKLTVCGLKEGRLLLTDNKTTFKVPIPDVVDMIDC